MNIDKLLSTPFKWDKRETILSELSHKNKVRFALFCAKQVKHLIDSKEAIQAIDIVELFLEDKATTEECRKAANAIYAAAYDTAYTASAASAASAAAYTAAAYTAFAAASYAASSAAYAAYTTAASTSTITNKDQLKQEQMDYLRELIMGELSKEERDNWLLIALI